MRQNPSLLLQIFETVPRFVGSHMLRVHGQPEHLSSRQCIQREGSCESSGSHVIGYEDRAESSGTDYCKTSRPHQGDRLVCQPDWQDALESAEW